MSIDKLDLIQEIEFLNEYERLGEILLKWSQQSDNNELRTCNKCLAKIGMYVSKLEMDLRSARRAIKDYQTEITWYRNQAGDHVDKIKKLEKNVEELRNEITDKWTDELGN